MTTTELCCPNCGSTSIGTTERLLGFAEATFTVNGDDVQIDHHGETEVNWDSSETIGVECQDCEWIHKGKIEAGLFGVAKDDDDDMEDEDDDMEDEDE